MIFCVFLDPECIRASAAAGEWGEDHLVGVLQCLLQNCLIAETSGWRVGEEIKDAVKTIQNQGTRNKVIALLGTLQTRSRFVDVIDDSAFAWDSPLSDIATAQAQHPDLDAILTQQTAPCLASVEFTKIQQFHQSNFAQERQRRSCGVNLGPNELSACEFFKTYFSKLHLTDTDMHVIDYIIGHEFKGNFSRNLEFWIDFLKSRGRPVKFTIHTTQGLGDAISRMNNRLSHLTRGSAITAEVKIHAELPHERFLVTTPFCFDIGRGIDLFESSGMNRDIRLGLSQKAFTFCI